MKIRSIVKKLTAISSLFLIAIVVVQCRKSNRDSEVKNAAPVDNATAVSIFNNIFRTVHSLAWENSLLNGPQDSIQSNTSDNCIDSVLYAYNVVTFPNTVVLYYGTTASSCSGGYSTSGKLKAVFSGQYNTSGSVVTVSFSNYAVDSIAVSGTMTITNNGYNADNNYVFNISVANAKLEYDTINISWNCSRKYEWIFGDNTDVITDDKFIVSGTSSGRTSKGNEFDVEITEDLNYSTSCKWITQGIIEMDLGISLSPRTLDYGNGTCDENVTVTYKNTTYDLEMR
ncbi:MAG: hypothetical protein JKY42_10065 [Flavobacteriales bacterium]|nr:hypothetical protein [Flavobacteriales bacterium]